MVYDLIGGRATWTALGLPTEGSVADRRRISNFVSVADTTPFRSTIGDVRRRSLRYPVAVVGRHGVVVGSLEEAADALADDTPVSRVMVPAPATIRSEKRVEDVVRQLHDDGVQRVFVTTVSGALMGQVFADELHI